MATRILIIEDDDGLREGLSEAFGDLEFDVHTCTRGDQVVEQVLELRPDVMLLDLMLPGLHGVEACSEVRARGIVSPILMLTALADEQDVINGLKAGADDYITKPFRLQELIARVEAQLRRSQGSFGSVLDLPTGKLDLAQGTLEKAEGREQLTSLELEVVKYLLKQRPQAVSRAELLTEVWGYKDAIATRTVDMSIAKLRSKLERDAAKPELIVTVREKGYRITV